ncbi:unnamed protein product, partial [Brenthis ino]
MLNAKKVWTPSCSGNLSKVPKRTLRRCILWNGPSFDRGDRWKVLRQNLTSLFSSSKLKNMFYLIENCATNLEEVLNYEVKLNKTLETKSILARFTMDCIGSCVFGVNTGTLEKNSRNNPFTILGEKLFDNSNYGGFRLISRAMWPAIFYKLRFQLFESSVDDFFIQLLTDVFKSRNYKTSSRQDFVDLFLTWKKKDCLVGDKISNMITDEKKTMEIKVDEKLLVGLSAMLFAAGYDTTSTTTSHLLFELAKQKEVQSKVIKEVDNYFQKHDGKLDFDCINEMPFLQACMDETLRLYPVLGTLTREVEAEYTLPTGLRLNKGMRIHIPVYYLHHNEEYFPEPEKFRPERFFGDEKKNIKQFTYMPFGEGPRICMGLRFAKMPMTAAIMTVLKKYRVQLADKMPTSLKFEPRCIVTQPVGGVHLEFIPRDT